MLLWLVARTARLSSEIGVKARRLGHAPGPTPTIGELVNIDQAAVHSSMRPASPLSILDTNVGTSSTTPIARPAARMRRVRGVPSLASESPLVRQTSAARITAPAAAPSQAPRDPVTRSANAPSAPRPALNAVDRQRVHDSHTAIGTSSSRYSATAFTVPTVRPTSPGRSGGIDGPATDHHDSHWVNAWTRYAITNTVVDTTISQSMRGRSIGSASTARTR